MERVHYSIYCNMMKIGFNNNECLDFSDDLFNEDISLMTADIWNMPEPLTKQPAPLFDDLDAPFPYPITAPTMNQHAQYDVLPFMDQHIFQTEAYLQASMQTPRPKKLMQVVALSPQKTERKVKHVLCNVPNCNRRVRSRGMCKTHGGGRKCTIEGCHKSAQNGELCIGHGGGKRCMKTGCAKAAQSHGRCKAHGGGARCKSEGCTKSSQGGGFCRAHGGGKRCQKPGCPKGAQRGSFCATHGGFKSCKIAACQRTDRGGGYCEVHRKDYLCKESNCKKLARNKGLCTSHIRQQTPLAA